MKEFLKENKFLLMVMLTIFLFTPIIISLLMFVPWLRIAKGDVNGWLSFWGSYIGGLFSGLMTFLGVYLAFKLERENEKKKRARRNYKITFDLFEWTNDLLKFIRLDGSRETLGRICDRGESILEKVIEVDEEWYLDFKYIQSNVFEVYISYSYNTDYLKDKENDIIKLHNDVKKYIKKP